MKTKKHKAIQDQEEGLGLKKAISYYTRKWKWFVLSLIFFVLMAMLYLRYTTPEYQSSGLIRLLTLNNNPTPEEAILGELGLIYGGDKLHTDEIQILRSSSLIEESIMKLGYNIQTFSEGKIKDVEIYNSRPLSVNLLVEDSLIYSFDYYFEIDIVSESEFIFTDGYGVESPMVFGSKINTEIGPIVITPSEYFDIKRHAGRKIKVLIEPIDKVAERYREKLDIYSYNDRVNRSNMIGLTVTDPVPEKASLLINEIIDTYNQRSVDSKKELAESTFNLINERVALISSDLNAVDSAKESFKTGNMITDVNTEAGVYVQAEAMNESELFKVGTELNRINYMIGFMTELPDQSYELLPTNIGFEDSSITNMTLQYNQLVQERNRILGSSGLKNPVVQQLNERLDGLLESLKQSLENLKKGLLIRQENLRSQSAAINSRIASVPGQERQNRNIQRQQNIKESIFLYLLQKREEAGISMATAYPSAEVIDYAKISERPVTPKKPFIFLVSLVFSFILPFAVFFLKSLLNTKVQEARDLKMFKGLAPLVGELPEVTAKDKANLLNSPLGEAMRVLRTNLDFASKPSEGKKGKVIVVTSSINDEGKTFIAHNLAELYTYSNKKVLLVGADIRKPNLHEYYPLKGEMGLSEILNNEIALEEVIHPTKTPNLFILHSGSVPHNPSELLMSKGINLLFKDLKEKFDIIIVDTAPTMLVTDTMLIACHANQILYTIRAEYTDKDLLNSIEDLIRDKKLTNVNLVLNAVRREQSLYYGKYGEEYTHNRTLSYPWYKRLYSKFNS